MLARATFVLLLLFAAAVSAHEVRPGYLQITESFPEQFDVLYKVPARGDLRLAIYALLPDNCEASSRVITRSVGASFTDLWSIRCPGGLEGGTIYIDGLAATLTDVLVQITLLDGSSRVARVTSAAPSYVVPAAPTWTQTAVTYLGLGVEHILLGIDHLLFVLALLLLVRGWRQVIITITSFTLAHSITLAAATLGLVYVPQRPVEAVIALSIVLVAVELVHRERGRGSFAQQWPWAIAFSFGLLHGFGFAGALNDIGLPQQAIPLSLLFFNIGVEIGQILFIVLVYLVWALTRRLVARLPARITSYGPAYAIGTVAAFWTIERIAGF
jgi:hydrogenase/urease accessory protein HupE